MVGFRIPAARRGVGAALLGLALLAGGCSSPASRGVATVGGDEKQRLSPQDQQAYQEAMMRGRGGTGMPPGGIPPGGMPPGGMPPGGMPR